MSATMLASTAALALMGILTLAAPSLDASLDTARGVSDVAPRLILGLLLLALLFASLVSTMMAARFYNTPASSGACRSTPRRENVGCRTTGVRYG